MIVFACASIVYNLGMGAGLTRSYYDYQEPGQRRTVIATSLLGSIALGAFLFGISVLFSREICLLLFSSLDCLSLLNLIFLTAFLESFKTLALTVFRTRKHSRAYSIFSLFFFLVQLGVILFLVVVLKWGVRGVVWGGLFSAALGLGLCIPLRRDLTAGFSWPEFRRMLCYSTPLVPDSLAALVITSADRIFLARYWSMSEVGIYSLGAKIGLLVSLILIEPFRRIWDVMVFSIAQGGDVKGYYTKLMTYFLLAATTLFLTLNCPIREVVQVISGPRYWEAWRVVPLLSLAYVFLGINIICTVGLLIERKTALIPVVTLLAAGVNVVLNRLLVPGYGKMGAAGATLAAYVLWAVIRYFLARRFYPIPYEWGRLAKLAGTGTAIFFLARWLPIEGLWPALLLKAGLGLSFPLWLLPLGFYDERERAWTRPARWRKQRASEDKETTDKARGEMP